MGQAPHFLCTLHGWTVAVPALTSGLPEECAVAKRWAGVEEPALGWQVAALLDVRPQLIMYLRPTSLHSQSPDTTSRQLRLCHSTLLPK
jgi:hypothetical protein